MARRSSKTPWSLVRWCCLFLTPFLWACGGAAPGAPLIRDFKFLGQDRNNPSNFVFQIEWLDNEGDLLVRSGDGSLIKGKFLFYVQDMDKMDTPKEVQFTIEDNFVTPGSTTGLIQNVGIIVGSDKYPSKIKFSVVMFDIQNNRSNQPSVILQAGGA